MERSRVILFGSIGAGVLVLGIVCYFIFAGDDTPTWDPSRPKPKPLVPKTYALGGDSSDGGQANTTVSGAHKSGETAAQSLTTDDPADAAWFVAEDKDLRYRVNFPTLTSTFVPGGTIKDSQGQSAFGETFEQAQGVRSEMGKTTFSVTAGRMTKNEEIDAVTRMRNFAEQLPAMLPGFEIKEQADISLDDFTGIEVKLTHPEKDLHRIQRLFVADERMFLQAVEGFDLKREDPYVDGFFDSLVISEEEEAVARDAVSADLDWSEASGAAIGFSVEFPTPDVQRIDILETLRNVSTRSTLANKWKEQGAKHESMLVESRERTYSVTAFVESNHRAPEFSRINTQNARMDALVKFWYGNEAAATKVNLPPLNGFEVDDALIETDGGKSILIRKARAAFISYLLRVEVTGDLDPTDQAAIKFVSSLKATETMAGADSAAREYKRAVVTRFHPYSGLDVTLPDGQVMSLKPTSLTKLLDTRGDEMEATEQPLAETLLKLGNIVNVLVEPASAAGQQQLVRSIQQVDTSRSSL